MFNEHLLMNVDLTIFYDFLKTAGVIFIDKGFTNRTTFIERRLFFYIFKKKTGSCDV